MRCAFSPRNGTPALPAGMLQPATGATVQGRSVRWLPRDRRSSLRLDLGKAKISVKIRVRRTGQMLAAPIHAASQPVRRGC